MQNVKLSRVIPNDTNIKNTILGACVCVCMGHTSTTITLDTYTDIDKTATKEKILKLYNNYYYIKQ